MGGPVTGPAASSGSGRGRAEGQPSDAAWISPQLRRVGILGGTFDPVHYGHLVIAEQVREALDLARVLFVPAGLPPHKLDERITPAADRAAMVGLAIADNPAFELCRIELDRDGPSYTVDSLELLAAEAARQGVERELYFILSEEALAGLPEWQAPERIMAFCRLAVVPRPGAAAPDEADLAARFAGQADRIIAVRTVPLANSASDVRRRAAAGQSIRYLVPPAVAAYIEAHHLYRSPEPADPACPAEERAT
jgi:nicotinate-nucleotide adenylyltransferase